MTREEAINMLKSKMDGHTDTSYEWTETVRMAIKALEQEPCEDCISRQAVKALIKRLSFKYYMECGEYIGEDSREVTLINALKFEECFEDLPPVKPKYTDEEIDKAQAVEQAYVDKMVELAVEESRREWLNSFDTNSATKCFEAVNLLKQRLEGEDD